MSSSTRVGLAGALALAAVACASTSFNSSWKNPAVQGPMSFKGKKVVAVVMTQEESVRYGAEDALAREITARGAVGIPAYSLIPKELTQDKEKAKEFLTKAQVAGAVVMRPAGKEQQITSSPGGYWGGPMYATFWGGVYSPSYVRTDTIMYVEILVYSLEQDKLVWAGRSETTNPEKVGPFIKELTAKAAAEMKKQGLIQG